MCAAGRIRNPSKLPRGSLEGLFNIFIIPAIYQYINPINLTDYLSNYKFLKFLFWNSSTNLYSIFDKYSIPLIPNTFDDDNLVLVLI